MTECVYQHIGDDGAVICENYSDFAHGIISFCNQDGGCAGKKPTNADRIRAMSDEELSKFLCSMSVNDGCCYCIAEQYCEYGHTGMIDWLKQEATDV